MGARLLAALASLCVLGTQTAAWAQAAHGAAQGSDTGGQSNLFAGDVGNAVWTLVIFLLVLFVLGKYAWGPILTALQGREQFIRDSLEKAKHEREAAEALLRDYEERLANSRAEATAIVEEGRRDAEAVRHRILAEAKEEGERTIERAKREIQLATDTATKELYTLSARLATEMAGRILGRELGPQDHERLVGEAIDQLDSLPGN
jgi:F-type H+-transporting ATPase subunit b